MIKSNKFKAIRSTKKLEFWYDKEFYIFELRKQGPIEYPFIWLEQEKIYGPFDRDQSEKGIKIYKMIQKKMAKGKIEF
jgi:hypothetical protein